MTAPRDRRNPDLFEGDPEQYYTFATLRDLFAGFAVTGYWAGNPEGNCAEAALLAGQTADAMLKERAK